MCEGGNCVRKGSASVREGKVFHLCRCERACARKVCVGRGGFRGQGRTVVREGTDCNGGGLTRNETSGGEGIGEDEGTSVKGTSTSE